MSQSQHWIHRCLCLLVFTVIFEGLARKAAPPSVGMFIFFFKDFITLLILGLSFIGKKNPEVVRLLQVVGLLSAFLFPCIILTAIHNPLLAAFGTKQYALFPAVAIGMCAAYIPNNRRELFRLFQFVTLSLIVTTPLALLQNHLPLNHWLNLSVGGEEVKEFAYNDILRVSSTFPFVAQYCYYLNALCCCLPAFFYFKEYFNRRMPIVQTVLLIGLLVLGAFVTGSRTAVIGNLAILSIGILLITFSNRARALIKIALLVAVGIALFICLKTAYPEYFIIYAVRSEGTLEVSHTVEIRERILDGLLGWTKGSEEAPPSIFGYGLGVMSNGSWLLSDYAADWRGKNIDFWTETDQATTLFEGGWYLVFVWYGFRLWIIIHSLALVFKIRLLEFRLMACFAWGFIFVIGVTGTLAIQPALAIWWWLAVGLVICLQRFDRERRAKSFNH